MAKTDRTHGETMEPVDENAVGGIATPESLSPPFPSVEATSFPVALGHSWSWFSQHAGQRMQSINYYLVAAALVTAGFSSLVASEQWAAAGFVAVVGALVSVAFALLDLRTRELVQAAESSLLRFQEELGKAGYVSMDFLNQSSGANRKVPSYRVIIQGLTVVGGVAFAVAAVAAFVAA